jgi:hypothetical protein
MPNYNVAQQVSRKINRKSDEQLHDEEVEGQRHIPSLGKSIPRYAHFVWEGQEIRQEYLYNILRFQMLNPSYQVIVWTSRPMSVFTTLDRMASDTEESSYRYAAFNFSRKINVESPERLFENLPYRLGAIHARESRGPYKNLAAASDIVRLAAIYLYGGIYLDVDVSVNAPLPHIDSTKSFRVYGYKQGMLTNGILAGVLKSRECFALLRQIENYYSEHKHVWDDKRSKPYDELSASIPMTDRYSTTIAATGPEMIYNTLGFPPSLGAVTFGKRRGDMHVLRGILADQKTIYRLERETILSMGHTDELDAEANWGWVVGGRRASI